MISAAICALVIGAAQSCDAQCANDAQRCYNGCNGGEKCSSSCNNRQTDCVNRCSALDEKKNQAMQEARAKDRMTNSPCVDLQSKKLMPCSDADKRQRAGAFAQMKADGKRICKDPEGNLVPCNAEKDQKKADEQLQKAMEGVCIGEDHKPYPCGDKKDKSKRRMAGSN